MAGAATLARKVATHVNEKQLFAVLKRKSLVALLDLLRHAYREMSITQRQAVFQASVRELPPSSVDGNALLKRVQQFHRDSLARKYYAPFAMNSKNYRHIPQETEDGIPTIIGKKSRALWFHMEMEVPS